jgi:hypothetical protein
MAGMAGRRTPKKAPACPGCGASTTIPIVYGFPSGKTFEAADRGELAIGGCVIRPEVWRCPTCGHSW